MKECQTIGELFIELHKHPESTEPRPEWNNETLAKELGGDLSKNEILDFIDGGNPGVILQYQPINPAIRPGHVSNLIEVIHRHYLNQKV